MSVPVPAGVTSVVQKIFLLAAGVPADTVVAPMLAQHVVDDGNWTWVADQVGAYLTAQAAAIGGATLVTQMAHRGLGIDLTPLEASAIAANIAAGNTTWVNVVAGY